MIYQALIDMIDAAKVCEDIPTACKILLDRTPYKPPFDADGVPSVPVMEKPAPKKKGKKKGRMEPLPMSSTAHALDNFIGENVEYNLECKMEYGLGCKMECDPNEPDVEKIDASATEVLSSDEEILVTPDRMALPCSEEDLSEIPKSIYDPDSDYVDDEDCVDDETDTVLEELIDSGDSQDITSVDIEPVNTKTVHEELPAQATQAVQTTCPALSEDIIQAFLPFGTEADYNRLLTLGKRQGYCVILPVFVGKKAHLILNCERYTYQASFDQPLLSKYLKCREIKLVTAYPYALYGMCCKAGILVRNVFPLYDMMQAYDLSFQPYENVSVFLDQCVSCYHACLEKDATAALLPHKALLCEAYGYSFYRDRFLTMKEDACSLVYNNGLLSFIPFSYQDVGKKVSGKLLEYSFNVGVYSDKQYRKLTEEVIAVFADKGLFRKMDFSILDFNENRIVFFAGDSCYRYLYSYIPYVFFGRAKLHSMKNFGFDLKEF